MAAEGVSLGKLLNAPEVALCVSVALSKIREAHEMAGVQPVPVGEAAERLHAGADQREAQERSTD